MKLESVDECEHGSTRRHRIGAAERQGRNLIPGSECPGGSRREASTTDLIAELKTRGVWLDTITIGDKEPFVSVLSFDSRKIPPKGEYFLFRLEVAK